MKPRNRLILAAVTLLILLIAVPSLAQGPLKIKVKGTEIVTGVVIVDIVQNGKPFELQCNAGAYRCMPLKGGNYIMVELPENFGMYQCRNVEIYTATSDNPETAEKLGEYCLIEK